MDLTDVARTLGRYLAKAQADMRFDHVLDGIRESLALVGIHAHRIQIPMSRVSGFRHPTIGLVVLTWTREDGFAGTRVVDHEHLNQRTQHGVIGSPFERVVRDRQTCYRVRLGEETHGYPLLDQLEAEGYRDYCAVGVEIPTGEELQPVSLAAREPFPDDVVERLDRLAPLFALALYSAYRTSQAFRIAQVYVGRESGSRVLAGEIQRGTTRRLHAGIVFCDIRGFTALSEKLGPEGVVAIVNEVFQVIGEEATARGGEILKFIGDAMLIVFPVRESPGAVAHAVVETARRAIARVAALSSERALPVAVGFGGHLGEVVQGNVGTKDRLDFTVMGPGVNLASRLEGLCKPLGAQAVFSGTIREHVESLSEAGPQVLKGIADPVAVWVLRDEQATG